MTLKVISADRNLWGKWETISWICSVW